MQLLKVDDRKEYLNSQIERSRRKFNFCKVSMKDALRYKQVLTGHFKSGEDSSVVCMGTRNGREVDLFRIAMQAPLSWKKIISASEKIYPYPHSVFPLLESFGRSNLKNIDNNAVVGVEINPQGQRQDILTCSFDELPPGWTNRFKVLFSNSFDHSMAPEKTVKEWTRVVKPGGVLIILWCKAEASDTDPLGDLDEKQLLELFKLPKLNLRDSQSVCGYNELFLIKE